MPTLLKIDIINEAYTKLGVSSLTTNPTAEDVSLALRRMLGVIAALPYSIGYLFPESLEEDDPNDDSGLTYDLLEPVSAIIAYKVAPDFDITYNPAEYAEGMATLARKFSEIEGAKYPTTLPVGIANEYPTDWTGGFYRGYLPSENTDIELP